MSAVTTKRLATGRKRKAHQAASLIKTCQGFAMEARGALMRACELDEALNSGDTLRLAQQAAQTLESLLFEDLAEEWTPENIAEALFDSVALIRAAATTTTDAISPERWALLDGASMLVDTAIGSLPQWQGIAPSGLGLQPEIEALTVERQDVIRRAGVEIIDWAALIVLARDHETFDTEVIRRRLPQLIGRIEELGSIVLSGVDDSLETTDSLKTRLQGWAPR